MLEIGMTGLESTLQLLGTGILFIIILVITYYTTKFVGGVKSGQRKKGNFKVVETYKITQNKYLQLIQIGTRYFVIAIGKNEIQYLTELKEEEVIQQEPSLKPEINFVEILNKVTGKQYIKNGNDQREKDQDQK